MAETKLNVRLQLRSDTLANWEKSTVELLAGEFAYATDVKKFKIGEGGKTWSQLGYVSADVVITEGTTDGTISVKIGDEDAVEVPVHGLGTAAFTDSTAYEAAGAVATHNTSETAHADIRKLIADNKSEIDTNAGDISSLEADVTEIQNKIPNTASASNQLATEDFVASSIEAQAARFITATNDPEGENMFASFEALVQGPWYYDDIEVAKSDLKTNDYAMFIRENTETNINEQWRALYTGETWQEQYKVGSALTSTQQAAVDSGITSELVGKISTNEANIKSNTTAIEANTASIEANKTAAEKAVSDLETAVDEKLATKQDTIEDVTDTAVAGKYVSAVSQKDGQITVTRANLPTVNVPVQAVEGVEGNSVEVTTEGTTVTVKHKPFTTGNISVTADTPYFINSIHVTEGHVDSATAQSLSAALTALGTITLNGGNAVVTAE